MKTYTIPFSYAVNATINVQGTTLDDAIAQVERLSELKLGYCPLVHGMSPAVSTEIDVESIQIDEKKAADLNPKQTYTVTITRTQTQEVEVEAHSAAEAEDVAIDLYDNEEVCSDSWSDEEVVTSDATLYQD